MKPPFDIDPKTGCWNWLGTISHLGYGVFRIGRHGEENFRRTTTHRLAWLMKEGSIPEGKSVLHKCNNPRCMNPSHLYLGDHKQNMKDRLNAGHYQRGEKHFNAKYSDADARRVLEVPNLNDSQAANALGFSRTFVRKVRLGLTRQNVTGGPVAETRKKYKRFKRKPAEYVTWL